ncbi:hypothetical protein HF086_011392 [Spodoptera exigua]|uniref:Uncharacterized protein n=1 Tax=Spodoptera exigua TaxID=7107 RepID=A0A922N2R1_SPOEX|nr:hypothetical protein HF086_011392 [Spodoptera exigua]
MTYALLHSRIRKRLRREECKTFTDLLRLARNIEDAYDEKITTPPTSDSRVQQNTRSPSISIHHKHYAARAPPSSHNTIARASTSSDNAHARAPPAPSAKLQPPAPRGPQCRTRLLRRLATLVSGPPPSTNNGPPARIVNVTVIQGTSVVENVCKNTCMHRKNVNTNKNVGIQHKIFKNSAQSENLSNSNNLCVQDEPYMNTCIQGVCSDDTEPSVRRSLGPIFKIKILNFNGTALIDTAAKHCIAGHSLYTLLLGQDPEVEKIVKQLEGTDDVAAQRWLERGYLMDQGVLFRYNPDSESESPQLVISAGHVPNVLKELHDSPTAGHPGNDDSLPKPVIPKRKRGRPANARLPVQERGRSPELEGEYIATQVTTRPIRASRGRIPPRYRDSAALF